MSHPVTSIPRPPCSPAELYRLLHEGNPGDKEFYLRACQPTGTAPQKVLEWGAGWGRMTGALMEAGCAITAVEQDPDFAAQLRLLATSGSPPGERGSLVVLEGDLLDLPAQGSFDRVLLPYNLLWALPGQKAQERALRRAASLLAPDGELFLDVYLLDELLVAAAEGEVELSDDAPPEPVHEFHLTQGPFQGMQLLCLEQTLLRLEERKLLVSYTLEGAALPDLPSLQSAHHFLTRSELLSLSWEAGLVPLGLFGGFQGEPEDPEAEHLVAAFGLA